MKRQARAFDERYLGGRVRAWWNRNAVLGGGWGEFLARVEGAADGALVLDVGAGEAGLRARLPRARYIAIDRGVGHGGWDYSRLDVVADALAIPIRSGVADVVISKQVLEHMSDPGKALGELRRVCASGGRVLLSTNQAWPQHQKPYDFFRFTSFGLRHLFEQAGFAIERLDPMGGVFSVALFHVSQTLAPHLWARTARAQRLVVIVTKPLAWLLRALMPLVTSLDRLDRTKDNTLGWYVQARAL